MEERLSFVQQNSLLFIVKSQGGQAVYLCTCPEERDAEERGEPWSLC